MFRGEYSHNIDPKGRLIIPAKFRDGLGENFVVTKEHVGGLAIYSNTEWEAFEDKLRKLPRSKAKVVRFFSGSAVDGALDKQGRVQLSSALREYAGLEKEVVIVGVLDRVEIWSKDRWDANNAEVEENIEAEIEELDF